MATVAKLVETLSRFLMVPIADVQHRARRLREAGKLPAEGLGRGAPHVDSHDCAMLLIAMLATDTATHAARAVEEVNQGGPAIQGVFKKAKFVMAPAGTLAKAIAHIIERLKDLDTQGGWANTLNRLGVTTAGDLQPHGWIETREGRTDYGVLRLTFDSFNADKKPSALPTFRPPGLVRETSVGVRELMGIAFMLERG